jgi:HEAT repeat protein
MKRKMVDRPVEVLLNDLKNPAVYVKKTAILQLEKRKVGLALPILLELVRDTEASIRSCVAWSLGQQGGPGVQTALVGMLELGS